MSIPTDFKKYLLFIIVPLLIIGIEFAALRMKSAPTQDLAALAAKVLATCKTEAHKPTCYDETIPPLMDSPTNLTMEEAFAVTKIVQDQDRSFAYCHVLGHELSAREVKKDPSDWKTVLTRCPSGVCSNGCLHGGLQERFRAESFTEEQIKKYKKDFFDLCEPRDGWNPTGLEKASCYHALGHLLMYVTNADIHKAVALCDEVTNRTGGTYQRVCYDGTFMQIYQPLEPEDFALVKGKQPNKDEHYDFCQQFTGVQRASCWTEGWPLFMPEIKTADGIVQFCNRADPVEQERCYGALAYIVTTQLQFDLTALKEVCSGLPQEYIGMCFANVASRLIETDYQNVEKSVDFCNGSPSDEVKERCMEELVTYSTFNFHAGSTEYFHMCETLPSPWHEKCLKKNAS
jgi:hypothetical protein